MSKSNQVVTLKTAKGSLLEGGLDGEALGTFGPSSAPPVQKTFNYPLQSFFDARFSDAANYPTTAAAALLSQPTPKGIVPNGRQIFDEPGWGVALTPDSDCPQAVTFQGVKQASKSDPIILRPGQVFFPFGKKGEHQAFQSLEVGLPTGWLGGGWASLLVLKSPKAWVAFNASPKEVLFHRVQMRIRESSLDAPVPAPTNWPTTFPWQRGRRGRYNPGTTTPSGRFEDQNGTTTVAIRQVTRTLMVLRARNPAGGAPLGLNGGGAPPDNYMRLLWWSSDHFDAGVDGLAVPAPGVGSPQFFLDQFWPLNQGTVAGMPAHDPVLSIDPAFASQRASLYGVTLEAPTGSPLIDQLVDVCRYGIL